jgi:hypothetical protein
MDKEKVLLTDNEIAALPDDSEETICKDQCRKLLDVLSEACDDHPHLEPRGHTPRKSCITCMAQIEEALE